MSKGRRGLKSNPFDTLERVSLRKTGDMARVLDRTVNHSGIRRIAYWINFGGGSRWHTARELEAAPEKER